MAVALILDFPGGTKEQYRSVVDQMDLGGQMPEGGLFHAAGSYEGGWRVIDVWESMARFEHFRDTKIGPLSGEAGMQPPQVRAVEVAERKPGSGATPELVQVVTLPGLDADSFRAADERILEGGEPPSGITFHVNGPGEGGWCVIDAWESKAERDRFLEERIKPATQDAGLAGPPQFEDLAVEATLREHAAARA
jgi:hypothetical protein